MNLNLSLSGRMRRSLAVACVLLSAVASSYGGQTIPGVDIIIKKTPGGKAVQLAANLPAGEMLQLNDTVFTCATCATISTTRSNSKGGMAIFDGELPDEPNPGDWTLDSFFDITYHIELEGLGVGGGPVPFLATGSAHVSGTGGTTGLGDDYDGDGDFDAEDFTQYQLYGPIHQFDVSLDSLELAGSGGILLRESPTLESTGQILRRDLPDGKYQIASFFDVFTELSIDGGATWTAASSSLQFQTVVPEPTGLALVGIAMFAAGISRRRYE
jgi:hypothetical protein